MGIGIRGAVESLAGRAGISEDECNGPSYEEGIDESVPTVMVDGDGTVRKGTYPQTSQLEGGHCVLELPSYDVALEWSAKFAVSCRCAQEVRAFHFDPAS